MHLETAQDIEHANVTEAQLREAFRDDEGRGEYIILSRDKESFIQASSDTSGFDVEYREGAEHFRADGLYSKAQVEQAFVWYLQNDGRWRTEFPWAKVEVKPWWKFW